MNSHNLDHGLVRTGSVVYALVHDMSVAAQIVKCAGRFGLLARNFDRAEKVIASAKDEKPFLVILDFEQCEVESYKTLKEMRENADFKGVPLIGFVTQSRSAVKDEAERAGCDRVFLKTAFIHELPDFITRYAK